MVLNRELAACAASLTAEELLMSVGITSTPTSWEFRISSAAACRTSRLRAMRTTFTPSAARPLAMFLPMPLLPPVMTAVRPLSPSSIYSQLDRDAALILFEPLIEILELRIQRLRRLDAARSENFLLEIAVHLEHVPVFIGALEAVSPIVIGLRRVVRHRPDAQALRQLVAHLFDCQVLTGDTDRLTDVLLARLENAVRYFAD